MSDRDIEGTSRADLLTGTTGDDDIRGREGNDRIAGGGGNDVLRGDEGDDRLFGGAGNDRLRGDKGDDELTGGAGRDRFIFNLQGGDDTVHDFTDGQDRLDFTNFNFATVEDLLANADQVGDNVVFSFEGGETVTLEGVQLGTLDGTDFLI